MRQIYTDQNLDLRRPVGGNAPDIAGAAERYDWLLMVNGGRVLLPGGWKPPLRPQPRQRSAIIRPIRVICGPSQPLTRTHLMD